MIAPVAEKVVAKETFLAGGGLQETGGDDLVGIHVLQWQGNAGGCDDIEFLFHVFTL